MSAFGPSFGGFAGGFAPVPALGGGFAGGFPGGFGPAPVAPPPFSQAATPRPPDTEPLKIITWYLESPVSDTCRVETPALSFELHHYDLYPLSAGRRTAKPAKVAIVSLLMSHGGSGGGSRSLDAEFELRLTVVRHVVKEMIRLGRWDLLLVSRVGDELLPARDPIYKAGIPPELLKIQPQVRRVNIEPKHGGLEIMILRGSGAGVTKE